MLSKLDRYILFRASAALLAITVLVILLVIGMDLTLRMRALLGGTLPPGVSRWGLIAQLYLYSLPTLLSPLLPLALAASAVVACAPSLKKGEFTALAAAGISLRRSTKSLIALALFVGVFDVFLSDQLAPVWESRRQAIEDKLGGESRTGRIWEVKETGTVWYANRVILRPDSAPHIEDLIIVPQNGMIHAKGLEYQNGQWLITGPILRWQLDDKGRDLWDEPEQLPGVGELALPYDTEGLTKSLISRHAMTSGELIDRGGHLNLSLMASRWSRIILPLAALLLVLPLFVRFSNRDALLLSGVRAIVVGLGPMLVVAVGAFQADATAINPLVVMAISAGVALVPGILVYTRWRM